MNGIVLYTYEKFKIKDLIPKKELGRILNLLFWNVNVIFGYRSF
jgi:hypothetical protein